MWERRFTRPVQGIAWMVLSGIGMIGVNGAVKYVGTSLPTAEAAFLRFAIGMLLFMPLVPKILTAGYSARIWGLFGLRGAVHTVAVIFWFYAMARVPVAEVSAIGFLNPVLVLVIGGLMLGEGVSLRRVLLVLVAFVGGLIVLRPGLREITLGHWSQLAATFGFAGSYIIAKRLSDSVAPAVIVAQLTFGVTLGLLPIAVMDWQQPALWQLFAMALAAAFATLGHYAMTKAFAAAPLAVTQPIGFLQIIWAALMGAALFGESIDPMVILGGAVIIGAITVNLRVEAASRATFRKADGGGAAGTAP